MNIGIIIQARTGSTRLPKKSILPFYKNYTITELIINRLKENLNLPIVLATTDSKSDDALEKLAQKTGIKCFRGDEQNVLKRFVDCAKEYEFNVIIRVCADNPFLDANVINELVKSYQKNSANYISYGLADGTPTIKTHYGIFSELVELKALELALSKTNDKLYLEHVTNFVYGNPQIFNIKLLPIPEFLLNQKIRLTLDTKGDFDVLSALYETSMNKFGDVYIRNVLALIEEDKSIQRFMNSEIEKQTK